MELLNNLKLNMLNETGNNGLRIARVNMKNEQIVGYVYRKIYPAAKETRKLVIFKFIENKNMYVYVEAKKCMLHVKLTV